ncbi:MAG: 2TM domain-containing protein [Pseudanabaenales cyanobacterium]|nr:2TM domain-containing protein [Pseudanabaenales cyanobacterium]
MNDLYPSEDAQQILQIAIARQTEAGELSRDQLLEIASELGIPEDTLWAAEQEWLSQRGVAQDQQTFDAYRRQKFQHHLVRYIAVNLFLLLLNLLIGEGFSWSLYVLLGWGLGLALHAWSTFQPKGFKYEEEFQKWRRRRQFKESFNSLLNRFLKIQKSGF